ncbi:hypothetical protein F6X38_07285 [Aureimonas leprariae]|uniref:Uncharacterized protein n=2 Tax=Plantimonas leprariae TaxID=2615207 RepID=A0A7V7PQT6_9HYPH|nr:hypothetical protein F6X38_07285 [Aureimonas leprariae]
MSAMQDPKDTHVVSRNSSHENERTPDGGQTPRVSDTLANARGGPDADHHIEAAANTVVDEESGASGAGEPEGRIEPLKRR